ncbi:MAG: hypothetical protein ACLS7Z_07805 [Christensenellales bacterium]
MKQKRLGGLCAAAIFLLCALMTGFYLIAGYGAYLDSDMASELALASHLAKEGALISSTWAYSTEVRVLSTQLVFTPLMALFPHNWRLVRTLGCLILQAALAASAYFCGRSLGARKRFALLFAGLSISVCSVVYAQMITIGAYYVPHAVLTNLYVGLTARLMTERKHGRRRGILALLCTLSVLMGASSIRYLFCATIPAAAAGVWAYLFPAGDESAPREERDKTGFLLTLIGFVFSVDGFLIGQKILPKICDYDAARYGGVRLSAFTSADMPEMMQQALGGLARLMGYSEGSVLLSVHGLASVGALLLPAAAAILMGRALKAARRDGNNVLRVGVLTLAMSAAITALSFVLLEDLYLNRYWIPLMTLGAPVMAACLSRENNAPLRNVCVLLFAGVVLPSAMQITSTMKTRKSRTFKRTGRFFAESGLTFGMRRSECQRHHRADKRRRGSGGVPSMQSAGAGRAAHEHVAGSHGRQADGAAGRAGLSDADGAGERTAFRFSGAQRRAKALGAKRHDHL